MYDPLTSEKIRAAQSYSSQARLLIDTHGLTIKNFFNHPEFLQLHKKVVIEFKGWAAHYALAAAVYIFALFPHDISSALYLAVHTPGDSDSIASLSGALIGAFAGQLPDESMVNSIEESNRLNILARKIYLNRPIE